MIDPNKGSGDNDESRNPSGTPSEFRIIDAGRQRAFGFLIMRYPLKGKGEEEASLERSAPIDSASRMGLGLAGRGFPLFSDMNFQVDENCMTSNAFLEYALSDDMACADFMSVTCMADVARLPLSLPPSPDPLKVLICAQKVQMLLYVAAEEIKLTLKNGAYGSRLVKDYLVASETNQPTEGSADASNPNGRLISHQDHYVKSLPFSLPLDLPDLHNSAPLKDQAAPKISTIAVNFVSQKSGPLS